MTKIKKQHYVPQFYLRNFSSDGVTIQVYDKFTGKVFRANIKDVGSEKYFYDIPNLEDELGVEQFIEKYFHSTEQSTSKTIANILDGLNNNSFIKLHPKNRAALAEFLALQFLRTKRFRNILSEFNEKLNEELFRTYLETINPELQTVDFELKTKEEVKPQLHALTFLDPDLIESLAKTLYRHIWIILKNVTTKKLYTSDNPVVKKGHVKHPVLNMSGIASRGIEIAFPISPTYILLLIDSDAFGALKSKDGKVSEMKDDENVTYYNSLQVRDSYRHIFSYDLDFDLAASMCDENPNLRKPDKDLVLVNNHRRKGSD